MRMGLKSRSSGGGNPDGLALDLQFAEDRSFTTDPSVAGGALITSRRGPAAKFMRATGATEVGPDGLIRYAPENLILPSGSATNSDNTYFTRVVTGDLDPDGDTTAEFTSLTAGSQARLQYTGILGFSYFSVWVKAKEGSPLPAYIHLVAGDGPKVAFNTSSWATVNGSGAIGSVEYGANGWVKLRSLFPATTASTLYKIVVTDGPTYGDGIAAGKVFILGGKQVSRNPSSQHYKTTSAPFYGPRFDHDPSTGQCKGLLIEEERRNLISHSEDMTAANGWITDSGTLVFVNNAGTSPSGTFTAEKLQEADTTTTRKITTKLAATVIGTTYILSVYAKPAERSILQIASSVGFNTVTQNFDLANNVLGTGNAAAPSIVSVGGGWYRCSIQVVSSATGNSLFAFGMVPEAGSGRFASYTGVVGNGIFLWGAQLEAGAFPTSYIPTAATVPLTRSADVCSITGEAFEAVWNPVEATVYAESSRLSLAGTLNHSIFSVSGSGVTRYGLYHRQANGMRLTALFGGSQHTASSNFNLAGVRYKAAAGLSASSSGLFFDATEIPDTTAGASGFADTLSLSTVGATSTWNGHLASLRIYRKRLTNAKLQALPAP
jgi:hypothetical protein